MSYATQCPNCQTRFKVTDAQLAVAEGLVRCGRCAHVFNAREALQEPPAPPAPAAPPPRASDHFELELPDFDPIAAQPASTQVEIEAPPFEPEPAPAPRPEAEAVAEPATPEPVHKAETGATEAVTEAAAEDAPAEPAVDEAKADQAVSPEPAEATPAEAEPAAPAQPASIEHDLDVFGQALQEALSHQKEAAASSSRVETLADVAIAAQAERDEVAGAPETRPERREPVMPEPAVEPEAPITALDDTDEQRRPYDARDDDDDDDEPAPLIRSRLFTVFVTLLTVLGLVVFLAQLIYFNRTRIAAELPELRPALEAVCRHAGCDVPWPTDAEYIRTEWSELTVVPDYPNLIQVSATLKNHAPYTQAFPAMELTLKDNDGQVLVRRNFAASDYLKAEDFKQGHLAGNSEVKITMRLDTGKLKPQGYSIFWFYP